ncbi:MAG TPA: S8 family serine peptidase, partial [Candidatus Kapabacteria bacterium]|nr:S8 family serine peptidase [Candidatus Kapabacteria bacterium]
MTVLRALRLASFFRLGSFRLAALLTFATATLLLTEAFAQRGTTAPRDEQKKADEQKRIDGLFDERITPSQRDNVSTQSTFGLLSLEAAGIETFWKKMPNADGRGVIIIILDSGVDPGLLGLMTTSEGKQKLIDVVDYSGTGDVLYKKATRSSDTLYFNGIRVLTGLGTLPSKAWNSEYYYGYLPEVRFQNGRNDLNFNDKDDDLFGVLVFEDAPGHFVAVVDADADGSLTNEKLLFNYRERFDIFSFRPANAAQGSHLQLNGGINIYPDRELVSLVFDDGSHGTHVAGIAGGNDINGVKGFDGVAPGAEMVGIKFADNSAGGVTVSNSMRQSYLYAANLAKTGTKPVVVNMSFGIGSEIEGQSAMDKWLDSLLAATPNLTVCISGSNDGPGLSNVGLPGSSSRVITSGAALPDDSGRDLCGANITRPLVWDFSSRGGELAKPDIVSPGTAVSTVPDFVGGDRYNGTSMASPYTAGCAAVIISAMKQQFGDWTADAVAVKRAIQLSAVHLPDQTPLDEGYGMINVPKAVELLSAWHRQGVKPTFHHVTTSVLNASRIGTAAYFRAGNFPRNGETQNFSIRDSITKTGRQRMLGMDAFELVTDSKWMEPVQSTIYRRGDDALNVSVAYKPELLKTPGLYSGRIWAYPKNASRKYARANAQFELLSSIVVPHQFSQENNYTASVENIDLNDNKLRREFFMVPAGTKAMQFTLSSRDPRASTTARLFDDDGRQFGSFSLKDGQANKPVTHWVTGEQLERGVIEVCLKQGWTDGKQKLGAVELSVEAIPYDIDMVSADGAQFAKGFYHVTNTHSELLQLQSDGELIGYERMIDTVIEQGDIFSLDFKQRADEDAVKFDFMLSREDYNLFTDITLQILRHDSSAVYNSAFDLRSKSA